MNVVGWAGGLIAWAALLSASPAVADEAGACAHGACERRAELHEPAWLATPSEAALDAESERLVKIEAAVTARCGAHRPSRCADDAWEQRLIGESIGALYGDHRAYACVEGAYVAGLEGADNANTLESCRLFRSQVVAAMFLLADRGELSPWVSAHCDPIIGGFRCVAHGYEVRLSDGVPSWSGPLAHER